MHKVSSAFFIVGLMVFGQLFSFSTKLAASRQDVPAELNAPANERLLLQVRGKGDQIYSCKEDGGKFVWGLKAPEAELTNMDGSAFGKHYAGPTWEAKDGSRVVGKAVANVASPEADAIPWLLVTVVNRNGEGVLGEGDVDSEDSYQGRESGCVGMRCRACWSGNARWVFGGLFVLRWEVRTRKPRRGGVVAAGARGL